MTKYRIAMRLKRNNPFGFVQPSGWTGTFTRQQAAGAYPNGTRVVKLLGEPEDRTPVGTHGTVLGSMHRPGYPIVYFVEWDCSPKTAIGVVAYKVERLC